MEGRKASPDQYFARKPATPSRPGAVSLVLPDRTLELAVDRGVFSATAVDAGTKYLLQEAPPPPDGTTDLLDLGSGYGPIAVTVALRAPDATVWAVDVNERAAALTAQNATAAGATNVKALVVPDDDPLAGVDPDVAFGAIYANPPIRIGKEPLHRLLATALDRLTPGGHAWLVVQKHLGADSLQAWLEGEGWATTRVGSRAGYRLLEVSARATPGS
jgi:16S rRNA (guanine1207-N2)-methyltransferase